MVYWPLEQLREVFLRQSERNARGPDAVVADVAGTASDVEEFWARAGENLRAGQLRMRRAIQFYARHGITVRAVLSAA